jgi:hypothetical protein
MMQQHTTRVNASEETIQIGLQQGSTIILLATLIANLHRANPCSAY